MDPMLPDEVDPMAADKPNPRVARPFPSAAAPKATKLPVLKKAASKSMTELQAEVALLRSKLVEAKTNSNTTAKKPPQTFLKGDAAAKRAAELEELASLKKEQQSQALAEARHMDIKEDLKEGAIVKLSYGYAPPSPPPRPHAPIHTYISDAPCFCCAARKRTCRAPSKKISVAECSASKWITQMFTSPCSMALVPSSTSSWCP